MLRATFWQDATVRACDAQREASQQGPGAQGLPPVLVSQVGHVGTAPPEGVTSLIFPHKYR